MRCGVLAEVEFAPDRLELVGDRRAARRAHLQAELRVVAGHLDPAGARAAHAGADLHGVPRLLRQGLLQRLGALDRAATAGSRTVPRARSSTAPGSPPASRPRRRGRPAGSSSSCRDCGHRARTRPRRRTRRPRAAMPTASMSWSDIRVITCVAWICFSIWIWSRSRAACSKASRRGSLLHAPTQVVDHLDVAAVEHLDRVGDVVRVLRRRDQADAGPAAAIDLVLQARAANGWRRTCPRTAAGGTASAAAAGSRAWPPCSGTGRRTVPGSLLRAAIERNARILVARHVDEREALVVLEQDVVARLVLLDQVELEQQRLGLRRRHRDSRRSPPARAAPGSCPSARGRGNSW